MDYTEFSQRFDVLYNNITSNQAPGLNEYEKSVFLTKGQDEYIKNQFYALSNPKKAGFDNSRKRHTDFAGITRTVKVESIDKSTIAKDSDDRQLPYTPLDYRSLIYQWPKDVMFVVNENLIMIPPFTKKPAVEQSSDTPEDAIPGKESLDTDSKEDKGDIQRVRQVVPITYDEYTRLMSRPFKQPLKYQAWRLLTDYNLSLEVEKEETQFDIEEHEQPVAEIILNNSDAAFLNKNKGTLDYVLRYIKIPRPIITVDLSTYGTYVVEPEEPEESEEIEESEEHSILTIRGETGPFNCELHESVHEEILQRAVELAKLSWEGTSQAIITEGQRSE